MNTISRRTFVSSTAATLVASTVGTAAGDEEEVIDIHQHVNFRGRDNETLIAHQAKMGVTHTILLPAGNAYERPSTLNGKGNGLQAMVFGTRASAKVALAHPEKFSFFCNEVPDVDGSVEHLETWLDRGALGIGESKFSLEIDSAPMIKMYEVAKAYEVPVLLHFQNSKYNLGFERFHKILERFPTVNFIGHAQQWWGNISKDHDQSVNYPENPVVPGGITDQYLSDYPNMFGDLSAGSGLRALSRDPEHAVEFLDRHHRKLMFGSDCNDHVGAGEDCGGSKQLAQVRKFVPDAKKRKAILSGNARKVIALFT